MSYTKTPWKLTPLEGKYYGSKVVIGDSFVDVWGSNRKDYSVSKREIEDGWEPDLGYDHVERQEDYANALLIAAAPDLYEALEAMVTVAERDGWMQAVSGRQLILWDAKVALSKARGESVDK
jgi:hypothetical protein